METTNPPLPAYRLRIRVLIIIWLLYFYSRWFVYENYYSFLDNVNLIFHEAGHVILWFWWEFITAWGGTIFQLLIPSIFLGYFRLRRVNLAWQLSLFWVGQNFLNISIYAADAIKQELPLLNPNGSHDWTYLLDKLWILAHADVTGKIFFALGSVLIFLSLWYMFYDWIKRQAITIGYDNE